MEKYKNLAIKIGLVVVVLALLASPIGQKYATTLQPLVEIIISQ